MPGWRLGNENVPSAADVVRAFCGPVTEMPVPATGCCCASSTVPLSVPASSAAGGGGAGGTGCADTGAVVASVATNGAATNRETTSPIRTRTKWFMDVRNLPGTK